MVPDPIERRWIEPRLTGLLGLDDLPAESREELFAAWRTFFERLADQATTILVFWDLQWADQGLLDFIEHLLTWARASSIFVLAEARPDLLERRPGWGATVRSSTTIHLEPLSPEDMRTLLDGLVRGLPEHAMRAIVERAEGVPLYAVETLRMLIDRGVLLPSADGDRYTLAVDLPELAVPATLQALIAARLDTLVLEDRSLLTDAAVLGLSFTVPSLLALTDAPAPAVAAGLDRLVRHQLLVLDADPRSPERGQFRFVQGVVREVAYASLAKRERRAKHVATARYLESLGDDELAGVLANHYLAAFHATPAGAEADALAAQARIALRAAADRAKALHSLISALGYMDQAITVTPDPRERAILHERAADVATRSALVSVSLGHIHEGRRIFISLGDRLGVLRTHALEASLRLVEHGDRVAVEILRPALADVADLPPAAEVVLAQSEMARALMLGGSSEAIAWADKVLQNWALVEPNVIVETIITKATAQMNAGLVTEAEVGLRGAIVVADRLGDTWASLRARNNLMGLIAPYSIDDALALGREIYEIAVRYGQRGWAQQAVGLGLGHAFDAGRWDDWLEEEREEEQLASAFYLGWFRSDQALRIAYLGETDRAEELLDELLATDVVKVSAQGTAGIRHLVGEVRLLQGRWSDAFEIGRIGWEDTEVSETAFHLSLLSAIAAADRDKVDAVADAIAAAVKDRGAPDVAFQPMGLTAKALLDGRWDDARQAYVAACRSLETSGRLRVRALFQMAAGHLAGDHFPEAAEGLREAETFFTERGAGGIVTRYVEKAVSPAPAARSAPTRSDGPRVASRSEVPPISN